MIQIKKRVFYITDVGRAGMARSKDLVAPSRITGLFLSGFSVRGGSMWQVSRGGIPLREHIALEVLKVVLVQYPHMNVSEQIERAVSVTDDLLERLGGDSRGSDGEAEVDESGGSEFDSLDLQSVTDRVLGGVPVDVEAGFENL
jgi:hypothetical protein